MRGSNRVREGQVEQHMVEDNTLLGDARQARQVVFVHHLPPPRPRLRRKMWARKLTRPIAEKFEMIDTTTSPTRPSPSNVEPIMPEAYHRILDNDWAKHVWIVLRSCRLVDKMTFEMYMVSYHPHASGKIVWNTDVYDQLHKNFISDR